MMVVISAAILNAVASITGPKVWKGLCLKYVRTMLGVAAKYPSAKLAYQAIPASKRRGGTPPAGYPVWWEVGTFWHVALSAGNGFVYSTDIRRPGAPDKVTIDEISKRWGARYLGWSTQINGVDLPEPVVAVAPKPTPKPAAHVITYPGHPITIGARGDAVKELQRHLKTPVTGIFTTRDKTAVAKHQRLRPKLWNRRSPRWDGIVGPKTYASITGHK